LAADGFGVLIFSEDGVEKLNDEVKVDGLAGGGGDTGKKACGGDTGKKAFGSGPL
jgi:hypothetical protein